MAMRVIDRTDRHAELQERALELIGTIGPTETVKALRREFGVTISRTLIYWWRRRRGVASHRKEAVLGALTEEQERRIEATRQRELAKVQSLPHRCPTCHGVGPAGACSWCGSAVP
jgi:transposase-like protein